MEKGWDARGRLKPLWKLVGGRDELAALTGILGPTLSGYNSGRLRLGIDNATRIVDALTAKGHEVSLRDVGSPELERAQMEVLSERVSAVEAALRQLLGQVDPGDPPKAVEGERG